MAGKRGLSIPRELPVCGFDDTPASRHRFPVLTTVRQLTHDMSHTATLELLKSIRSPSTGKMVPTRYTLELRESIGNPENNRPG